MACCIACNTEFDPTAAWQRYCSLECRRKAAAKRRRRKREGVLVKPPKMSIEDMVSVMLKLSKKRGHTVQYGELQRDMITGKVKIIGGRLCG